MPDAPALSPVVLPPFDLSQIKPLSYSELVLELDLQLRHARISVEFLSKHPESETMRAALHRELAQASALATLLVRSL